MQSIRAGRLAAAGWRKCLRREDVGAWDSGIVWDRGVGGKMDVYLGD